MGFSPITGVWVIGLGNSAYADLCSHKCFLTNQDDLMWQMYKDFLFACILFEKIIQTDLKVETINPLKPLMGKELRHIHYSVIRVFR